MKCAGLLFQHSVPNSNGKLQQGVISKLLANNSFPLASSRYVTASKIAFAAFFNSSLYCMLKLYMWLDFKHHHVTFAEFIDKILFAFFLQEIYPGQFQPSLCHKFIALMDKERKLLRNYTQNIDTLEQVAGIQRIIQCHGK